MKIRISHKYLIFPVNTNVCEKLLTFSDGTGNDYKLDIRIDYLSPNFKAYIDVSRYIGQELSVFTEPQMDIRFDQSDTMDISGIYAEEYRPQVHFTTKNGWINDPNGLIYFDGKYHLFYQHNPCEPRWGNMHWGHATSPDMIHWEETDIALFPDKTGTMFSGSAIADEKNLLGLQDGTLPTVLLYYSATEPFSQYVAYSTDGLKTVHKMDKPVIPKATTNEHDPKVIFCEEWNAYALVIYAGKEVYAFYRSDDLLHWEKVQEITTAGQGECPDLFPLAADDGKRKWVFIGAKDKYIVGDMRDGKFCPVQEMQSLHYGSGAYAGQVFSGLPNGRIVRMDWQTWKFNTPNIRGQMSFPTELTLKQIDGVYYLCALPIKEIESICDQSLVFEDLELQADVKKRIPLAPAPYLIKIEAELSGCAKVSFNLFGRRIVCDATNNKISLFKNVLPMSLNSNKLDLVIITDQCSLELYSDGGKFYTGTADDNMYCDRNLPFMEMLSNEDLKISHMEIHSLKSIWRE